MLKKLLLTCISVCILFSSVTAAQAENSLTDNCDDFSNLYEYSECWEIKSNNSDRLGGDTGRFQRTTDATADAAAATQYITYYYPRVESAKVLFYYTSEDFISGLKISGSSDNVDYTEITTSQTEFSGCSGSWSGVYISTTSIPSGVKYIKIEIDKSVRHTGCGIGQVTLIKGESTYVNTAIPEPGENNITEDDCMNFDIPVEKSTNWKIETTADLWGDTGRIMKSVDTGTEYLVYKVPSAFKMDMKVHYSNHVSEPFEFITVETSPNGTVYTEAEGQNMTSQALSDKLTATVSFTFPEGTDYIKISLAQTDYDATWWLSLSNLKFYSSSPYEIKNGDIQINEGIASADYIVTVNYEVYENITMYLAAYDERGLLLDISSYTVTAEEGDVQISASLNLPEGTEYVQAYFLNSLQGMHRICETKEVR